VDEAVRATARHREQRGRIAIRARDLECLEISGSLGQSRPWEEIASHADRLSAMPTDGRGYDAVSWCTDGRTAFPLECPTENLIALPQPRRNANEIRNFLVKNARFFVQDVVM
jgi:hypothetical protein